MKFDYKTAAFELLAKSKNLKDDENYGMVFIAPDRSREQRDEHKNLFGSWNKREPTTQAHSSIFGTRLYTQQVELIF